MRRSTIDWVRHYSISGQITSANYLSAHTDISLEKVYCGDLAGNDVKCQGCDYYWVLFILRRSGKKAVYWSNSILRLVRIAHESLEEGRG